MNPRRAAEAVDWARREWGTDARVAPLGDLRFRYHVRGRRVDGSRRNPDGPRSSDDWVAEPFAHADGLAGLVAAAVMSAVLWLFLVLAKGLWLLGRLFSRELRRGTATVLGGPRQLGVRFADSANQHADVWLVWDGSRMALLHVRPKWCQPLWQGEQPGVERRGLRWPDGSRVRLPKGILGEGNL